MLVVEGSSVTVVVMSWVVGSLVVVAVVVLVEEVEVGVGVGVEVRAGVVVVEVLGLGVEVGDVCTSVPIVSPRSSSGQIPVLHGSDLQHPLNPGPAEQTYQ